MQTKRLQKYYCKYYTTNELYKFKGFFPPHCSNHHNKHLIPYGSTFSSWLNHARKKAEELVMSTHTCCQNTKNITLMSEVVK